MVGDLARWLAWRIQRWRIRCKEAVVMIDEIELHLHPRHGNAMWLRLWNELFPAAGTS